MIDKLVKIADQLDSKGKTKSADLVDGVVKYIMSGKQNEEALKELDVDEPTQQDVEQLWEEEANSDDQDLKPGERESIVQVQVTGRVGRHHVHQSRPFK